MAKTVEQYLAETVAGTVLQLAQALAERDRLQEELVGLLATIKQLQPPTPPSTG